MSATDRRTLARLLPALVEAVEQTDAVPPMFFEPDPKLRFGSGARVKRR